jgi:hypothetical protein
MADVVKVVEKAPLAPIAAFRVTPLSVMATFSVAGGKRLPAATVPEKVTDGVPYVIMEEAERLEKAVDETVVNAVGLE